MVKDQTINPGDLVYVARDCCGHWLGRIFTVGHAAGREAHCDYCRLLVQEPLVVNAEFLQRPGMYCAPLSWLRRIPPLSELENIDNKEEIPA